MRAGSLYTEMTAPERRAARDLREGVGSERATLAVGAMTGLLVALAAFFVAFAPGA